tara:strand:- start:371 stop:622 length:252 start_codon:yes stop_codon:yes gene_type:complete
MKAKLLSLPLHGHHEFQLSLNIATMTSPNMLEVLGMNSQGLVHALEESFPPTNPTPDDTMQKIMYRSGQRSVVEWVIKYLEDN